MRKNARQESIDRVEVGTTGLLEYVQRPVTDPLAFPV